MTRHAQSHDSSRRAFLKGAALGASALCLRGDDARADAENWDNAPKRQSGARRGNLIAVSSYSYWHFDEEQSAPMDMCLRKAAETGFDGFEVLEQQLDRVDLPYLRTLRRDAFRYGISICSMSTHQTFVRPDAEERKFNVEKTKHSIDLANEMGIPTLRVNTGRWDSWGSFDALMEHRGIEEPLPGHTNEEAFQWCVAAFEELLPYAESKGVMLCLENHWGLARTAKGLLALLDAVDSPWFGCMLDTGNFLDDTMEQIEMLLTRATCVQAKTYYGGGVWYELPLDYQKIGELFRKYNYRGFVSLEFEGKESAQTAVPKSLALLRENLYF
ncbi:MAG: sugar phosphate isomerase/epimerase family protein [Planctomycetia bacterium]|nr:sugar phosphate isomerase/epimerase family protein [Planctomycetia bacterium]